MWIKNADFLQTVKLNWFLPCTERVLYRMVVKLKRLNQHLEWWNRDVFGNVFDNVRKLESNAAEAELVFYRDSSASNRSGLSLAKSKRALGFSMEEAFWKQKAACKWAAEGERNTKLFHNMVNRRRSNNKIYRIWENGIALENYLEIQESGAKYFETLLHGEDTVLNKPDWSCIPSLITTEENDHLLGDISEQELFECIKSLNAYSAAGPDGFSAGFFQNCWDIIKMDLLEAVREFLLGAPIPRAFTATTIVLIPKELVNQINVKARGGNIILKLDMAKAYDRVVFMGFHILLMRMIS
ncbi:uncharacterized protein [Henckelia pumila]|uniref:uncharacterized protein isoform X2 n=1 Tax=Henckelia pumila TaxID=405737 RepID=UPI003C6E3DDE